MYAIRTVQDITERYETLSVDSDMREDKHRLHHPVLQSATSIGNFIDACPIFDYPWFQRTWVLQEVVNAKAAAVRIGQDVVPWPVIVRLNDCIDRTGFRPHTGRKSLMPTLLRTLFPLAELDAFRTDPLKIDASKGHRGILEVITSGLDLDATDVRDKLFALLQFGQETEFAALPSELRPNYEKNAAQVFSDFTRWWVKTYRSLRILSTVHLSLGRTWQTTTCRRLSDVALDRPTWCLWPHGESSWTKATLGLASDTSYHASGLNRNPELELISRTGDPAILSLAGRKICTIERIGPFPYYQSRHMPQGLFEAYNSIFDPIGEHGSWTHRPDHSSAWTNSRERTEPPSAEGIHYLQSLHFHAHPEHALNTGSIECHDDCLFISVEGLFGLCPQTARPGDLIVVLYGGNVPYLLRERKESEDTPTRFEFVGECYLQGYMHGRAMQESEERRLEAEVFDLV